MCGCKSRHTVGVLATRPGKHTKRELENGPVEIVDLPSYKMVDLSIATLNYQRVKSFVIWVNYNDLTTTSLESWLIREIIPKWP